MKGCCSCRNPGKGIFFTLVAPTCVLLDKSNAPKLPNTFDPYTENDSADCKLPTCNSAPNGNGFNVYNLLMLN